jgi:hypothetical protein
MAADMTLEPWTRLARLAPPGTIGADLQSAADRWALTADVYAAAADLWEEAAMAVDTTPDEDAQAVTANVQSVSQDGISITYASDGLIGNSMSSRIASQAQMLAKAKFFRSRAKAKSVLVHELGYNPWINNGHTECDEIIIKVDEV